MSFLRLPLFCLLAIFLSAACEDAQPPAVTPVASDSAAVESAEIDSARYIRAAELMQRLQDDSTGFVFDVRSRAAYGESHIDGALSMPYGKVEKTDLDAIETLALDTPIVTYCGCPHHLAGLAADQLIEWGYSNVRVLYEGYWFWVEKRFPIAGAQTQALTELHFAGTLRDGPRVRGHTDVFIRNLRNGQLEAALTDESGRFETAFHVFEYRPDDRFEVRVGSIDAPVSQVLDAGSMRSNQYRVF